jgi:hypothetical protein
MRHGSVKKRRLKRQSGLCDVLDAELDIGLRKATKVMQLIDSLLRELAIRGNLSGKPSTFSSDVISGKLKPNLARTRVEIAEALKPYQKAHQSIGAPQILAVDYRRADWSPRFHRALHLP